MGANSRYQEMIERHARVEASPLANRGIHFCTPLNIVFSPMPYNWLSTEPRACLQSDPPFLRKAFAGDREIFLKLYTFLNFHNLTLQN